MVLVHRMKYPNTQKIDINFWYQKLKFYVLYRVMNLILLDWWRLHWEKGLLVESVVQRGKFISFSDYDHNMDVFWYELARIFVDSKRSPDYYISFVNCHMTRLSLKNEIFNGSLICSILLKTVIVLRIVYEQEYKSEY